MPLAREVTRLEQEIAAFEAEQRALEAKLADTSFYTPGNAAEVQSATRRCAEVGRLLEQAEERWLEVQSALEAIGEP
jgi:ATP-binding cassette subfamily F protein 3